MKDSNYKIKKVNFADWLYSRGRIEIDSTCGVYCWERFLAGDCLVLRTEERSIDILTENKDA